jgi:hypothetical protein
MVQPGHMDSTSEARTSRSRDVAPVPADARVVAWRHGIRAGLIGAAVVATLFLMVDLAAGRPLWTPALLGSVLFTGERLPATGFDPWARMELILGYTAVHGAVFVGYGACVSLFLATASKVPRQLGAQAAIVAATLFLLFELTFLAQAALFEPGLTRELGTGWVATANACAAAAMGIFLARHVRPTRA